MTVSVLLEQRILGEAAWPQLQWRMLQICVSLHTYVSADTGEPIIRAWALLYTECNVIGERGLSMYTIYNWLHRPGTFFSSLMFFVILQGYFSLYRSSMFTIPSVGLCWPRNTTLANRLPHCDFPSKKNLQCTSPRGSSKHVPATYPSILQWGTSLWSRRAQRFCLRGGRWWLAYYWHPRWDLKDSDSNPFPSLPSLPS